MFIRGQSVTQRSMGRKAPGYPPSVSRSIKRSNFFSKRDISSLAVKGLKVINDESNDHLYHK